MIIISILSFVANTTTGSVNNIIFDSGLLVTISIIVFSTLTIAFISHIKKDKCLKNFKSDIVTVYYNDGRVVKGSFDIENTGSEIIFVDKATGEKKSQIIYKDEYNQVRLFARYYKDMSPQRSKELKKIIKKTYHPNVFRRIMRNILIFFKIIRDSLMDIFSVISGKIKTTNVNYAKNEAYISNINKEAVTTIDPTYNPLLEKYIGNRVVCSHVFNGEPYECRGIIKDYTSSYLELLDANYSVGDLVISGADIVIPRNTTRVRHLADNINGILNSKYGFHLHIFKKQIKKSNHNDIEKAMIKND